jgi:adenylate cyclase class IV
MEQRDVFFPCAQGRLKLRHFGGGRGELIQYERTDDDKPRLSHYVLVPTDRATDLEEVLRRALGTIGSVEKTRWLYLVGQTRVHLDEVRRLGWFFELEVVLRPEQPEAEGRNIAEELMREFGIAAEDIVPGAYIDLLLGSEHDGIR